ncbi:MAG: hypothetical protein R6X32_05940 [Chloroflexota bacterium]
MVLFLAVVTETAVFWQDDWQPLNGENGRFLQTNSPPGKWLTGHQAG